MFVALPLLFLLAAPALAQASVNTSVTADSVGAVGGTFSCTGSGVNAAFCQTTVPWTSGSYLGKGTASAIFTSGGVSQTATCSSNTLGGGTCTSSPVSIGGYSCTVSFTGTPAYPAGAENGAIQGSTSCALLPTGTISASPNPCSISAGASTCSSTISWSTANTPSATITIPNGQTFAGGTSGSQVASWIPNGSVLFTLRDSNGNPLSTVNVTGACASGTTWNGTVCAENPPTATLTASPNPVAYDGRSTLTWSSTNATSCTAGGPWSNSGTLSGSGLTNPLTSATTFTFQCTGPGGTSPLASVTVNVNAAVVNGACASTHYSCTAGTSANNVAGATAYTWTCQGSGGGTDASCSEAILPTATLSASPTTITTGGSSTLTWSSTNATSCTSAGGFSTGGATSGSVSVSPSSTSSYQIYCDNANGRTYSNIVTVTVSPPPILSINAAPSRVLSGGGTTVSWSATNVTSCTITRNGALWQSLTANFSGSLSGSTGDSITSQTVYVMTCNNKSSGATATATQIVNVVQSFQEF